MPQPACDDTHIVDSARIAHQHRLDEGTVVQPPQRLAGGALSACIVCSGVISGRQQRVDQRRAQVGRQVGHVVGVVDQPGEVVVRHLLGPETWEPGLLDRCPALG